MNLNFKPWDMGCSYMDDAIIVFIPINSWISAHFAKNNVNLFHALAARAFKNTVGNAAPCITGGEFDLHAKFTENNIRENVWMRVKINCQTIAGNQFLKNFPHTVFKYV